MVRHATGFVLLLAALGAAYARAQEGAPPDVVVLDTLSVWRMHSQLAPPVLGPERKGQFP